MTHSQNKKPYPTPLTIPPLSTQHTHTFIILHGRGSNAERFGRELLSSANLAQRLPTVKFVFPTARKRRSTALKRIPINQWFDNYSLDDPNVRPDLQIDGLMETAEFLRELISQEARVFENQASDESGYRKIVLGGLSQGCAAGIFTLLGGLGERGDERVGAFFGMSGWLPFERQLGDILGSDVGGSETDGLEQDDLLSGDIQNLSMQDSDSENEDDESEEESDSEDDEEQPTIDDNTFSDTECDPFAPAADEDDDFDPFQLDTSKSPGVSKDQITRTTDAINHIRDILDLPPISTPVSEEGSTTGQTASSQTTKVGIPSLQTPVFLGHGCEDPKVSVHLGEKMARLLADQMQMNVTWKAYEGLGHWYRIPNEIDDIIRFLQEKVDIQ
ncbi:uncharacterized protein TRUGW13939_02364 [Talaromyces rugulosus]|uniref:Acyl-protein thioesterase 1 n=1 Tax=Talaromyces rugulosus TaxID=121627 RepID=A0A7H8QN55_TALRU|nr:uncharacterized protein TRUGW13939_02364 [Talaromyces rugulosus]QKX55272.1 hypothetical protein TRUGW13939_02364 [Talaromyces rugulosus]